MNRLSEEQIEVARSKGLMVVIDWPTDMLGPFDKKRSYTSEINRILPALLMLPKEPFSHIMKEGRFKGKPRKQLVIVSASTIRTYYQGVLRNGIQMFVREAQGTLNPSPIPRAEWIDGSSTTRFS